MNAAQWRVTSSDRLKLGETPLIASLSLLYRSSIAPVSLQYRSSIAPVSLQYRSTGAVISLRSRCCYAFISSSEAWSGLPHHPALAGLSPAKQASNQGLPRDLKG